MSLETLRQIMLFGIAAGTIVAALCAYGLNVVSQKITEQKEQIAAQREAALNRPLIQITPKRFDSNQFLKVTLNGKGIILESLFEMTNAGKLSTKFIAPSSRSEGAQMMNPPATELLRGPFNWDFEGIALSPNESKVITIKRLFEWHSEKEARFNLQQFISDPNWAITTEVAVVYSHPADDSLTYKTIGQYRIGLNEAKILKIDYQDISPARETIAK